MEFSVRSQVYILAAVSFISVRSQVYILAVVSFISVHSQVYILAAVSFIFIVCWSNSGRKIKLLKLEQNLMILSYVCLFRAFNISDFAWAHFAPSFDCITFMIMDHLLSNFVQLRKKYKLFLWRFTHNC